jgi:hypothetical protein
MSLAENYPGFYRVTANLLLQDPLTMSADDEAAFADNISRYEALELSPSKVVARAARRAYGVDFAEVIEARLPPMARDAFARTPLSLTEKLKLWLAVKNSVAASDAELATSIWSQLVGAREIPALPALIAAIAKETHAALTIPPLFADHKDAWFALQERVPVPPVTFDVGNIGAAVPVDLMRSGDIPVQSRGVSALERLTRILSPSSVGGDPVGKASMVWDTIFYDLPLEDASTIRLIPADISRVVAFGDDGLSEGGGASPWRTVGIVAGVGVGVGLLVYLATRRGR